MIFRYRSPVGTFVIAPRERGHFELLFGDETLRSYRSPQEAAVEVFRRATGFAEWDGYETDARESAIPERLEEWECWRLSSH